MTRHTPRPSHYHEVSPLTPKGPPSYCQCLVHDAQRATHNAPATVMRRVLSPLKDPPRTASVWCMAHSVPSSWRVVQPGAITSQGPVHTLHHTLWKKPLSPQSGLPSRHHLVNCRH
ncbi:hypothetical protein E2C01_076361 [Portunus trituberculatus]|uniref:Uncharacterized protein n=1 Tax=Portunus trituberculatus TaxID=210409 RepID=A0A5B7IB83_PORTR|nr:hypothetical protein [Portunus trituberculatus]